MSEDANEKNVLIVDDNRSLAENVCEIIDGIDGHSVTCHVASDRRSALEVAANHDLDAAVIDVHLPDGDGFDLVSTLRRRSPFVQILIMTGDATVESAITAVHQSAFAYVLKPFNESQLVDTLARALAQAALIREREELRLALERSEQRHREVVENVPAFVLALDDRGRIVLWNAELERVTGFLRSEMIGKPGLELVGAGEIRKLPLKGGGHRLVRWHRAGIPDASHPYDVYAMGVDVTDEREMMRRTLRAERLAAVGTLAAGLAHEVRNPLNSASLQLQVLRRRIDRDQVDTEWLRGVTQIVSDEIDRLDHLVSDFLDFARPRELELTPTDLNQLVGGVLDLLRPEAESRGVAITRRLSEGAGRVEIDPERIRQVFLNLFRNALEAVHDGGSLTVETGQADDDGFVPIEVVDDGPGFPEDAPIFDAFYTTKEGGSGLGLAIVHQIVTAHGGEVRVRSMPGDTRFTVTLPQSAGPGTGQ